MSPRTQATTPTNSSIRTLKANYGSATTLDLHLLKNKPKSLNPPPEDLEESFPSLPAPPLQPPFPLPHPIQAPPSLPPPAKDNNLLGIDLPAITC